jgi:tetratricopeptide (TPR) repeat protein
LVHAKGNLLYALGDVNAAASAFGEAVLIAVGCGVKSIDRLISQILTVWSTGCSKEHQTSPSIVSHNTTPTLAHHPSTLVLLSPENALQTVRRMFPQHGQLPGLRHVPRTYMRSAVSTVSNSLLSLAKIFQDGMNAGSQPRVCGTAEILGLYYLSLALQPSPSTANNVGILLASIPQQPCHDDAVHRADPSIPMVPGIKPGSGVALALAYYNYGLNLDPRHAHLYTNLGSLLKDIGQLAAAVKMYEQAVTSDPFFDIALANLANAVKDQGRVGDAIVYYKRAVAASPNFAEAVCGLANALNSVCSWNGRGGVIFENARHDRWHVMEDGMLQDAHIVKSPSGWMQRVADIVLKQLRDGSSWGCGTLSPLVLMTLLRELEVADTATHWPVTEYESMRARLQSWYGRPWEGARVVRLIERAIRRAMHRRYRDKYIHMRELPAASYCRPHIPQSLSVPSAPTVLPFHTFTCPLDARAIRETAERNALRISCATLKTSWLPETVYPPPPPPMPHLNVGYVSSDFNNHPLAHLMQSVFGLHNPSRVKAFCYATTPDDHSVHRRQIEKEAPVFRDVSSWAPAKVIDQIIADQIHILVNLNGYTRGAKNEIFAARPVPIQMSFMGFAGSLGAEWCDYLLADSTTVPPRTLRPWRRDIDLEDHACYENAENDRDWVYSENIIVCRDTFFCCDHRQAEPNHGDSWRQEERRRRKMRRKLFPNLPQNAIILANFNQLYKVRSRLNIGC